MIRTSEKTKCKYLSKSSWVWASLANLWITPWSVITFFTAKSDGGVNGYDYNDDDDYNGDDDMMMMIRTHSEVLLVTGNVGNSKADCSQHLVTMITMTMMTMTTMITTMIIMMMMMTMTLMLMRG